MRQTPPALLPLLRSRVQGDVLALLYLHPEQELSLTDIAGRIGASVKSVQQEVDRLVRTGFLTDRRLGTSRLVRSVQDSLLTRPLTDLMAVTYGPLPVLTEQLHGVEGMQEAYIYGSWAARYNGEAGPLPGDVDVLVVGRADLDTLHERARAAELVLRRDVNIRRVHPDTWEGSEDPFITTVRSRPLVRLAIDGDSDGAGQDEMEPGAVRDRPHARRGRA